MKKLILTFFAVALYLFAQSQTIIIPDNTCMGDKRYIYQIPKRGVLIHIRCKTNIKEDLFILKNNNESLYGKVLNENYEMIPGKKKVKSFGPNFLLIEVVGKNISYKYDFDLGSWVRLEKKPPTWSTGERE
jgi:hypothetical protein